MSGLRGRAAGRRLRCTTCGTAIEGQFSVGRFGRLSREQMYLLESFLRARGNLRDMERELGISYPTVRNRVEALVRALGLADGRRPPPPPPTRTPPASAGRCSSAWRATKSQPSRLQLSSAVSRPKRRLPPNRSLPRSLHSRLNQPSP